jgi:two-component system, sensor histidine kinase LadS
MKIISLIFFLVLYGETLLAQDILKITSVEEANRKINDYIYIFEDASNSIDLRTVLNFKEPDPFLPIPQFTKSMSSKYSYWIHFSVEISLRENYQLGLSTPLQDHLVDIYSICDSVLFTQKTGLFLDGEKNDEVFPFSNIIQVKAAKKIDFYLKVKNINDELPLFSLKFVNLNKAIKQYSRKIIFDGFANGIMWLMILYGLFLFLLNKDKLYLYYSLYIIFISAWYIGCMFLGYRLFPEMPRKIFPYTDIPGMIGYIFYIQFIRLFINSSSILPKWDKVLKLYQIILSVICIGLPVCIYVTNLIIVSYIIGTTIAVGLSAIIIILIIRVLLLRNRLTNIIAIGSFSLVLGAILTQLSFLFSPSNYMNEDVFIFQKLGFLIELVVFTFGITYRYKLIEADKQKFQKQLIIQLNENAELQGKVNRELSEKVKEATAEIVARNKEITDSIHYASLIQTAVLPSLDFITELGIDNFILFKPKEVVSGDFYWGKRKNTKIIIAAGDCTGHGVPGAFMSMLGHAFLDEIINTVDANNAAEILDHLRIEVIRTMKQKGKRGEAKDGMDMVLCIIDKKAGQLMYSGANNPLYLIRDNNLIKIEADKMPIGIHDTSDVPFTNQIIEIRKGDIFYLFSDGFADQFGGPNGKKFMYKAFQELLIQNHAEPMEQQKEILDVTFERWKGEKEQIDDVMVIGLRI